MRLASIPCATLPAYESSHPILSSSSSCPTFHLFQRVWRVKHENDSTTSVMRRCIMSLPLGEWRPRKLHPQLTELSVVAHRPAPTRLHGTSTRSRQGAPAKRTQDTFVWGLGNPPPQVSCEPHRTDPPTHDREQPRNTCKHAYFTDSKFKAYPPWRRWARGLCRRESYRKREAR